METDIRDIVQKDSVWGLFDYGGVEKGGLELLGMAKQKNSGIRRS